MLVTDHAPLQWLQQMRDVNPQLTQWYLALQPFAFPIQYHKWQYYANVDYFSQQGPWLDDPTEGTGHLEGETCEPATDSWWEGG